MAQMSLRGTLRKDEGEKVNGNTYKVLTLGDLGVGKTCLVTRFLDDKFNPNYLTTIGMDCQVTTMPSPINPTKTIKVQIWDTAGQERFRTITRAYYRGAHAVLLLFDVTNKESYDNVSKWLIDIQEHTIPNIIKVLIANKCDVEQRIVTKEQGKKLADSYSNIQYFETSARTGDHVKEVFDWVVKQLEETHGSTTVSPTSPATSPSTPRDEGAQGPVRLEKTGDKKKKEKIEKGGCSC